MKTMLLELKKENRTGIIPMLLAVGILGALYEFLNFIIRKDSLLSLPLPPMDILLTQLYGMIIILNLFALIVSTCMIYNLEFKGNAIKKMYMLPVSVSQMYMCKFIILLLAFAITMILQYLALIQNGITKLPEGTFEPDVLIRFAWYTFGTSIPVLSFMLLISSQSENMWIPLGVGVAGFLSAMALASAKCSLVLLHPFVIMLQPAVAMSAVPNSHIFIFAICESALFLTVGLLLSKYKHYE